MHRAMPKVRRLLAGAVLGLIGISGLLKLMALDSFQESLHTWDGVPAGLLTYFAVGVPIVELWMAVLWFAGRYRLLIELTAFGFLGFTTSLYAIQAWLGEPPTCGCLGLWQAHYDAVASSTTLFWRNGVLMLMLASSLFLRWHVEKSHDPTTRVHPA